MKKFRKAHLGKGLALGLAAMLSQNASAVNLATDGIGEVAIAPYYTTRDGWQTLVNLTNTTQHPVVVKLRVHEAWNSRDVGDFTIFMSSFDNFTAIVTEGASGPVFRMVDQDTCTAPLFHAPAATEFALSAFAYGGTTSSLAPRESDGGPTDIDRLREGYIEFIVEGHYTNDNGDNDVVNDNNNEDDANGNTIPDDDSTGELIESHRCADLLTQFTSRASVLEAAQFAGEPINALKFNYRLINVARGVEAGGAATAWANFFNPGPNGIDGEILSGDGPDNLYGIDTDPNNSDPTLDEGCLVTRGIERGDANANTPGTPADEWDPTPLSGDSSCLNLITAQNTFDFLEPTLNDAYPAVAHGHLDRYNRDISHFYGAGTDADQVNAFITEGRHGLLGAGPFGDSAATAVASGSIRGIDALSLTIQRSAIVNEWAENTGVATDWIVNFPTKTFYVDQDAAFDRNSTAGPPTQGLTGVGRQAGLLVGDRDEAFYASATPAGAMLSTVESDADRAAALSDYLDVPYPPFSTAFVTVTPGAPSTVATNNLGSPVRFEATLYDREENTIQPAAGGGPIISPAPPEPTIFANLNYETNVISFNGNTSVLGSQVNTNIDTAPLTNNGWMHLRFIDPSSQAGSGGTVQDTATGLLGWSGIPTTGFVVKQRNVGAVNANYASSMDHGYRRECVGNDTSPMLELTLTAFVPGAPGCPSDATDSILTLDP